MILEIAKLAKETTLEMSKATSVQKNTALSALIEQIRQNRERIIAANREDILQAQGLSAANIDRLSLQNRLDGIIDGIEQVICLPDPIHEVFDRKIMPNQLHIEKRRTPMGVIGVIYESRPNVTVEISALTIKSGNCVILRGGSESIRTNCVFIELIQNALKLADLPATAVQLIANADRKQVHEMLQLHEHIDLIIPRGSAALQEFCRKTSTIPVISGGVGICHLFVDASADQMRALDVIVNAKTQRPTVCNALDTLLVHASIAKEFLPRIIEVLSAKGVTFRVDEKAFSICPSQVCSLAEVEDWNTEWLSLVLSIKVVSDIDEAIKHIREHSTKHSDGIMTEDSKNAEKFIREIDSAAVYVNASTRFTDGNALGLGAEVAISTQKLHVRGPVGLMELTTYKWIIRGNYHQRL